MNEGKEKCKILREIRIKIAKENNIPFNTKECDFKGECMGTCPKCDSELVYLQNEINKRSSMGKVIALSASMAISLSACGTSEVGDIPQDFPTDTTNYANSETNTDEMPTISSPYAIEKTKNEDLEGDVPYSPKPTQETIANYLVNNVEYPVELVMTKTEASVTVKFKYGHNGEISDLSFEGETDNLFKTSIKVALEKMHESLGGAEYEEGLDYEIPLEFKFSKYCCPLKLFQA